MRFAFTLASLCILLCVVIIVLVGLLLAPAVHCQGCGIKPIKPIPPIGCKDLVAECQCDSQGRCAWVWRCVPSGSR